MDGFSIGIAINSIRALVDIVKNIGDAQLAFKIQGELASIQGDLLNALEKALALQGENSELKAQIAKMKSFVFHDSVYWKKLDDETEDGPFCPICMATNVEMRLIKPRKMAASNRISLMCPENHSSGFHANLPIELLPAGRYYIEP